MSTKEVAKTDAEIVEFDVTGQSPIGVVSESGDQISLDTIGDKVTLRFMGKKWANTDKPDDTFLVLNFEDATGKPLQMNAGAKLTDAFSDIAPLSIVTMIYVKDIDTGQPSPMKDYRVEVYPS